MAVAVASKGRKSWLCWLVLTWLVKTLNRDDEVLSEIECHGVSGEDMGKQPLQGAWGPNEYCCGSGPRAIILVRFLVTWIFRVGDRDVTCIRVLHLKCRWAKSDMSAVQDARGAWDM